MGSSCLYQDLPHGITLIDTGYHRPRFDASYLEHAGGAGALLQHLPNAHLVAHPRGAAHMIDPAKLIAGASAVYGVERFKTLYGDIVPVAAARVIEAESIGRLDWRAR